MGDAAAPESWADYVWPEFVPAASRAVISDFWRGDWGRGPREWLRSAAGYGSGAAPGTQVHPALGARVRAVDGAGRCIAVGRFIHTWNNMGQLVLDDGEVLTVSSGSTGTARGQVFACGGRADPRRRIAAPHVVFLRGDPVVVANGQDRPLKAVVSAMFYEHEDRGRWQVSVRLPGRLGLEYFDAEVVAHDPDPTQLPTSPQREAAHG